MSFKDIRGQDNAVSFLKAALENDRTAHAYIFLGPAGVGRKKAAFNFAKALNCQNEASGKPCDGCIPCKKIDAFNHPDIFLLEPEKKGGSISIDQMRELMKNIGMRPYEGKKKVYILDEVEEMKHEASNAMLKTLEEPPPDSVLILIIKDLNRIFKTIVSRSQVVRFFPLNIDTVNNILIEEHKMDESKAHILSRLSSGSMGEALKLKEEDFFEKRSDLINGLLKNRFFYSDFEGVRKEEFQLYLGLMLSWYRDILIKKLGMEDASLINVDRKDAIEKEAERLEVDYLESVIKEIMQTNSFLDQNANPKLAMSVLGFKIQDEKEDLRVTCGSLLTAQAK